MRKVITRRAALAEGLTPAAIRHRLSSGAWQRIFVGTYATHTGVITWRERVEAAVLTRGEGAVVTLECALTLWGLSHREPPLITLAEPWGAHRVTRLPGVRTRRRRRLSTTTRYGVPVTSLPQTILDVIALRPRDVAATMALITRAVSIRKVTVAELRAELVHHPRHPARQLLDEALRAAEEGARGA